MYLFTHERFQDEKKTVTEYVRLLKEKYIFGQVKVNKL